MATQVEKKKVKQFSAFITDIVGVMEKHNVKQLLAIFRMNGEIRNTYLRTADEEEDKLYSFLSDGVDAWLKQRIKNNQK